MWTLIFLIVCAYIDLRTRQLPAWLLAAAGVIAVVYRIWNWEGGALLWLGGAGVGALFLAVSRISDEALGYGDSWLILFLGILLGLRDILWLLSMAFMLSGAFSIVLLMRNRYSRKMSFPFVPFLALAYMGVMYL